MLMISITKEICKGVRSIGMMGRTPDRIRKHMENSATFDPENIIARGGPCDGEYYGLPWPCWDELHPGTPLLWDDSKPVSKGGHDFRALWGDKVADNKYKLHVGESMLKAEGGKKMYSMQQELTMHLIPTGEAVQLALAAGDPPTGRGRAGSGHGISQILFQFIESLSKAPDQTPDRKYPTYADKDKTYYRVPCEFKTAQNPELVKKFPIILTTGRQVEHMGRRGSDTR